MKKPLLLAVLFFALSAVGDQITFSFIAMNNTDNVNASASGLTLGPALNVLVSDSTTGMSFPLAGIDTADTGTASSFTILTNPNLVVATYDGSGAMSVLIANTMGHVFLSGEMNDRATLLAGYPNAAGSFLGKFTVDFVDPAVLAMFGLGPGFNPSGSFSATFGQTQLVGQTLEGVLGGGSVTIQTSSPVPEPIQLGIASIGILMLGAVARRSR